MEEKENASMRNGIVIILAGLMLLVCTVSPSFGSWLVYSKPEFRGRIIDTETKQPIEGVVVVAMYQTHTLISGPGGGHTSIIHVKEALSDKSGEFHIPSYTTIIQPNSLEDRVAFIIYKPGYGRRVQPPNVVGLEKFFSQETGTKGEILVESIKGNKTIAITYGVVELTRLETKEERLRAVPGRPSELSPEDIPLLYKAINEERKRFGLGPIGRVGQ